MIIKTNTLVEDKKDENLFSRLTNALKRSLVSSRAVAIILSLLVSSVTSAFLSLIPSVNSVALSVCFLVSFSSSFLLIYIAFEFLIFKEINNVYSKLSKIKKKDFKFVPPLGSDILPSANPIRRVNQEITAYAGQKQQEIDELRRMEVFRREFIADVSHELKTPIFSAQGFILTLIDGAVDDENVRDLFLGKAARSLKALAALVEDLLTLSQIESGDITMRLEKYDMQEQVLEVFEQLENKAERRGVALKLVSQYEEGIYVYADYNRIRQVLINLIINAIKYGKENGAVTVTLTQTTKNLKVSIKDDGNGIEAEHLTRIFERFYRIEKSRSKQEGGTGLGLAIVKHIIEKHDSKISVKSKIGEGTQFTFKLQRTEVIEEV
ncbi:histidine kinase [Bernardetia litoralis DSM 6794]|uniref:histidine kinase n=1 Tax=Bernardetia litoralis (strain ATCC 23117 / DSM 6794 / NBRC 15988 / NCIMB 1366 / Fx l1 / Sio-4) TaxID=880071 RepID=I4AJK1_BERLS|nr:ATP-binding protein [Bernardetia litoralis]AFM04136.1 histidine kinase [Bernardetia litoralis DSM 6794]